MDGFEVVGNNNSSSAHSQPAGGSELDPRGDPLLASNAALDNGFPSLRDILGSQFGAPAQARSGRWQQQLEEGPGFPVSGIAYIKHYFVVTNY